MHPLCARVVPRSDELLRILMREGLLVIRFFEGARHGGVPIFNVKTTRKANVPVVVALVDV